MIEDLASLKAATIGRRVSRAGEGYALAPATLAADQPARDAAILNSLRACQVTLDTGQHVILRECLGAPQSIVDRAPAPTRHASRPLEAGLEAPRVRAPSLERGNHRHNNLIK